MNSATIYQNSTDGRVTFKLSRPSGQECTVEMTYHLLNPSPPFQEVVEKARSVVLAGGTMSPVGAI
jgi:chromosome transmission fidelity protein 1